MSLFFTPSCWQRWRAARSTFTAPLLAALKRFFAIATNRFDLSAAPKKTPPPHSQQQKQQHIKHWRPSFYLLGASAFLLVAAGLSIWEQPGGSSTGTTAEAALLARGWKRGERLDCPDQAPGAYYELEGENENTEAFAGPGYSLSARTPLPPPPYLCRKIFEPHFIEEI